mmetsp:Transcript_19/g.68  ORF Transcript_19/g.68 Transcript_19/m.68 type:complete len:203 (+) Transcript_19:193-801(+)
MAQTEIETATETAETERSVPSVHVSVENGRSIMPQDDENACVFKKDRQRKGAAEDSEGPTRRREKEQRNERESGKRQLYINLCRFRPFREGHREKKNLEIKNWKAKKERNDGKREQLLLFPCPLHLSFVFVFVLFFLPTALQTGAQSEIVMTPDRRKKTAAHTRKNGVENTEKDAFEQCPSIEEERTKKKEEKTKEEVCFPL